MKPRKTDKALLGKGIQQMAIALIFMFMSPVIIHSAFKNQSHPYYIYVLSTGIIGAIFSIYMAFRGLKIMMDAIFGKKQA